ncbi:MAG: hypothetical protein AAF998_26685 [Bacteroidota bacterium]
MSESKLEYFLTHLSGAERERFRAQLADSQRKRDRLLARLLELLIANKLPPEAIYADLYPQKHYSEKQMRNLRSALFNQLTDFLTHRLFANSPEKTLFFMRAMNDIGANKYFPAILEKHWGKAEDRNLSLDYADLDNRVRIEEIKHQLAVQGRQEVALEPLLQETEAAFVARMLHHVLAFQEAKRVIEAGEGAVPPTHLWPVILAHLEAGAWSDSPLVQLYFSIYQLVSSASNRNQYLRVKSMLTAHSDRLDRQEASQMYTLTLNHCIRQYNLSAVFWREEIFHLYREMIARSVLVEPAGISAWRFKSVVSIGVQLREFAWVETFVERHRRFIPREFREATTHFCWGLLAFFRRSYPEAEANMHTVLTENKDPFLGLDARAYLLRIYYETENEIGLNALINSFRQFLRRHPHLAAERLASYYEFIRFFRRLHALNPNDQKRADKLRQEIESSPYRAGRDWFLEKLAKRFPTAQADTT